MAGLSSDSPFSVTFDATTPSGNAALVGFIAGHQASLWSSKEVMSYQCHTKQLISSLVQLSLDCVLSLFFEG